MFLVTNLLLSFFLICHSLHRKRSVYGLSRSLKSVLLVLTFLHIFVSVGLLTRMQGVSHPLGIVPCRLTQAILALCGPGQNSRTARLSAISAGPRLLMWGPQTAPVAHAEIMREPRMKSPGAGLPVAIEQRPSRVPKPIRQILSLFFAIEERGTLPILT